MFNVEHVRCFLAQIGIEQVSLFITVLLILTVITWLIRTIASTITQTFPHKRMTILSWVPLFTFLIYLVGFFGSAYIIFNPSQNVYLGFLASVLVGVVIAAQDIFQSIIAGIVLLIDKPFQVGDRVTFEKDYGEVVDIGLRSVKVRTLDEHVVTIPNSRFIKDIVNSSSAGNVEMMVSIDTHVPSSVDLVQVKSILEKAAFTNSYVNIQKPIAVVAKEILNGSGTVTIALKAKCVIKDDRTEQAFQTDFITMVNRELSAHNLR